tara:strand:- start:575 stop:763 length:189 start_codon:yes stop_codon:yes gene_type:complete
MEWLQFHFLATCFSPFNPQLLHLKPKVSNKLALTQLRFIIYLLSLASVVIHSEQWLTDTAYL